ncbi:unnamed protein product [Owenia fusiformis]|uniref:Uncharacterized protein n=1 Tax=Owenia fusiformis TaxID=6347 RepID=A0A8S4Q8H9_OWEFU|nr:unnamed protein product [Owenia fusiformis]
MNVYDNMYVFYFCEFNKNISSMTNSTCLLFSVSFKNKARLVSVVENIYQRSPFLLIILFSEITTSGYVTQQVNFNIKQYQNFVLGLLLLSTLSSLMFILMLIFTKEDGYERLEDDDDGGDAIRMAPYGGLTKNMYSANKTEGQPLMSMREQELSKSDKNKILIRSRSWYNDVPILSDVFILVMFMMAFLGGVTSIVYFHFLTTLIIVSAGQMDHTRVLYILFTVVGLVSHYIWLLAGCLKGKVSRDTILICCNVLLVISQIVMVTVEQTFAVLIIVIILFNLGNSTLRVFSPVIIYEKYGLDRFALLWGFISGFEKIISILFLIIYERVYMFNAWHTNTISDINIKNVSMYNTNVSLHNTNVSLYNTNVSLDNVTLFNDPKDQCFGSQCTMLTFISTSIISFCGLLVSFVLLESNKE